IRRSMETAIPISSWRTSRGGACRQWRRRAPSSSRRRPRRRSRKPAPRAPRSWSPYGRCMARPGLHGMPGAPRRHAQERIGPDGTKLHADVLRPLSLAASTKTPVIVSVGPYFNHSGQTGPLGPVEGTPYDPTGAAGPSSRFFDFVNGAHLMDRGYTYVMVDLR